MHSQRLTEVLNVTRCNRKRLTHEINVQTYYTSHVNKAHLTAFRMNLVHETIGTGTCGE